MAREKELQEDIKSNIKDLTKKEKIELLYDLKYKAYFNECPVSIEEFIEKDEFLGTYFKDKDTGGSLFYPYWMEILKSIYPNPFNRRFNNVLILGPIGGGKTTCSLVSIAYEMHILFCMKNPNQYYNIDPGTSIIFAILSENINNAISVDLAKLLGMLNSSSWFRLYTDIPKIDDRGAIKKDTYEVPLNVHNLQIVIGSKPAHVRGKAPIVAFMDEAEFHGSTAGSLYNNIESRIQSRFRGKTGEVAGILFAVSSPEGGEGFLKETIKKVEAGTKKALIIKDIPVWEMEKHLRGTKYSNETFTIFLGNEHLDPTIVLPNEKDKYPEELLLEVPLNLKEDFETDIVLAIKDKAGYSAAPSSNLFRHPNIIRLLMTIPKPFDKEILELDLIDERDQIIDKLNVDYFRKPNNPDSYRFFHLDPALTGDRFGIAAVYAVPKEYDVKYSNDNTVVNNIMIRERFYYIDFAFAVQSKAGQEVPFYKIRQFFFLLRDEFKFPISLVTADQFQSVDTMQTLSRHNFEVGKLSLDVKGTGRNIYIGLKNEITRKNILMYENQLLYKELSNLKDNAIKIDHPRVFPDGTRGSKDVADAVAGAYWNCHTAKEIINKKSFIEAMNKKRTASIQERMLQKARANGYNKVLDSYIGDF